MEISKKREIDLFISDLSKVPNTPTTFNPYFGECEDSVKRRGNLKKYLALMLENKTKIMFVGEAPGYHGCKFTGIAFTCEHSLKTYEFLGRENFETIHDANNLKQERSATIVWEKLSEIGKYPLLWNIFPFHPHPENNDRTNRTPNSKEVQDGFEYTERLMKIFGINEKDIYSIGRKAERMLKRRGIPTQYLRHPARGGKGTFCKNVDTIKAKF